MMLLRRVSGTSMLPSLVPGTIIAALKARSDYRPDDVIVLVHGGREIIKRITEVRSAADGMQVYVRGDNAAASTDSRQFGWLPATLIKGRVIWPRRLN